MNKFAEIALAAIAGAVIPAIGVIYAAGAQSNRVEQLERRVSELEKRAGGPDPAKAQCAKLAEQYAAAKGYGSSSIKDAMDALGCFRAN
jgi:hypothetical protein